ncbi:MAG TPA: lysoplasmalogenase [Anaerolineaceae bacterium]|nr:lysoplasmalogenase [Anaerolineaceae bacterium]
MYWFYLACAIMVIEWYAAWREWTMLNRVVKPAALLALNVWFWSLGQGEGPLFWFGIGLIFSLLGDILLLSHSLFLEGLTAFLLGHIFYIVSFNPTPPPLHWVSLLLIAGIGAGGFFIVRTIRRGLLRRASGRKLRLAVVLYGSVISLMLLSTLFTLLRPEWPPRSALLACVGGALFVFSDSLLAFDRFVQRLPHGRFWVMLTYHLGQIGLSSAMLVQAGILKLSAGG